MAIDDPVQAIQQTFDNEDRASDPVLPRLARFAAQLPLPWPADKTIGAVLGLLTANRIDRIELTLAIVAEELRRHESRIKEITSGTAKEAEEHFQEWFTLVEDGLNKAERTRAKERIRRIGIILANSLVSVPAPDPDDVEEMTRIATELSDREVQALNDLVLVQGAVVERLGRIARYDAWNSWPKGPWGEKPDSEIDSIFRKLESFGLVTQIPPQSNINITADIQNRYALLKKGLVLIRFAQRQ